jgi:hypothetical protein
MVLGVQALALLIDHNDHLAMLDALAGLGLGVRDDRLRRPAVAAAGST